MAFILHFLIVIMKFHESFFFFVQFADKFINRLVTDAAFTRFDFQFKIWIGLADFADIFKGNALNNGLLPVQVSESFLSDLFNEIESNPKVEIEVDLEHQTISILRKNISEKFEIDAYKKTCLINGYDDIDYLINNKELIEAFEAQRTI